MSRFPMTTTTAGLRWMVNGENEYPRERYIIWFTVKKEVRRMDPICILVAFEWDLIESCTPAQSKGSKVILCGGGVPSCQNLESFSGVQSSTAIVQDFIIWVRFSWLIKQIPPNVVKRFLNFTDFHPRPSLRFPFFFIPFQASNTNGCCIFFRRRKNNTFGLGFWF